MIFPDLVKRYVSPSPISLKILQARHTEEGWKFAEFKEQDDEAISIESWPGFKENEKD